MCPCQDKIKKKTPNKAFILTSGLHLMGLMMKVLKNCQVLNTLNHTQMCTLSTRQKQASVNMEFESMYCML